MTTNFNSWSLFEDGHQGENTTAVPLRCLVANLVGRRFGRPAWRSLNCLSAPVGASEEERA